MAYPRPPPPIHGYEPTGSLWLTRKSSSPILQGYKEVPRFLPCIHFAFDHSLPQDMYMAPVSGCCEGPGRARGPIPQARGIGRVARQGDAPEGRGTWMSRVHPQPRLCWTAGWPMAGATCKGTGRLPHRYRSSQHPHPGTGFSIVRCAPIQRSSPLIGRLTRLIVPLACLLFRSAWIQYEV